MEFTRFFTISIVCSLLIAGCNSPTDTPEQPQAVGSLTDDQESTSFVAEYICSHFLVKAKATDNQLTLTIEDRSHQLSRIRTASGQKYSNSEQTLSFWLKGDKASLELNNQEAIQCQKVTVQRPDTSEKNVKLPFTAQGNEPGWMLKLDSERYELITQYGQHTIKAEHSIEPFISLNNTVSLSNDDNKLTLMVSDQICHDTMTGMPYPYGVTINTVDESFSGCGGEPKSLLVNHSWAVLIVDEQMVAQDTHITLQFDSEMTVTGVASCNRYQASYSLTGEGLSIGPIATTQMACNPTLMEQEAHFLKHLANVVRFDVSPSGQLTLYTNSGASLVARPDNS